MHLYRAISGALRGYRLVSMSGWGTYVSISLDILLDYLFIRSSLLRTFSCGHKRCVFNSIWNQVARKTLSY